MMPYVRDVAGIENGCGSDSPCIKMLMADAWLRVSQSALGVDIDF